MASYSPFLPLTYDPLEGYKGLPTIKSVALQNLKMLLYTEPGERIWDMDYGVGIKKYLFEQSTTTTLSNLEQRIRQQVSKYLAYITILQLNINPINQNNEVVESSNFIKINILFSISGVGVIQFLDSISIQNNNAEQ